MHLDEFSERKTSGRIRKIRFMIDWPLNIRRQSNVIVINKYHRVFVILKRVSFVLY